MPPSDVCDLWTRQRSAAGEDPVVAESSVPASDPGGPSELDFGQNLNGLAIDQGAKHGVHQFLYGHGQAETARKIAVVSTYPANALSPALSKLAKVELRVQTKIL
jgi:hypothetical protein